VLTPALVASVGTFHPANGITANGDRLIWLPHDALAKLRHLRGPGESYSDVILRLAAEQSGLEPGAFIHSGVMVRYQRRSATVCLPSSGRAADEVVLKPIMAVVAV
jgi:hypothetical protein